MSQPAKKTIELFYDVISPYTWIAFEELCRYRSKWNIELKFRPMFLGGIMKASDNRPPGMVPAKAQYMHHDIERLGKYYHVPFRPPANPSEVLFVKGSLPTQRFLTAVQQRRPELVESLSREFWMRIWNRDEDIVSVDSLKQAGKKAGLSDNDVDSCLKLIDDDDVKEKLKQTTNEAIAYGAFGSPTIIVHDGNNQKHLVFGSDRTHIIAMLLGEKYMGPLTELAQAKL